MKKTRHTTDQIIEKLRQADVALGKGQKVPEICKILEITEQTYYRWRQKYVGMAPEMAKQLKSFEKENTRLKKLVAEQALDNQILKEAARGNWPRFWGKGPSGSGVPSMRFVAAWGQRRFRSVVPARY
jgi:putative transposase